MYIICSVRQRNPFRRLSYVSNEEDDLTLNLNHLSLVMTVSRNNDLVCYGDRSDAPPMVISKTTFHQPCKSVRSVGICTIYKTIYGSTKFTGSVNYS